MTEELSEGIKALYRVAHRGMDRTHIFLKRKPMEEQTLKITMEQKGCLIEVVVPESALPDDLLMKEYMQNTAVDMYARLRFMMRKAQTQEE